MKYIFSLLLLLSFNAYSQDSANRTITVIMPVKAIVLYGENISRTPSWENRKMPDALLPLIGSGTKPDSLVTVTVTAGTLFSFIQSLMSERFSTIDEVAHSIFNNSPAISGYTALFTQIVAKANGNTSEKGAGTWIVNQYNTYSATLTSLYTQKYQSGLNWIRN